MTKPRQKSKEPPHEQGPRKVKTISTKETAAKKSARSHADSFKKPGK